MIGDRWEQAGRTAAVLRGQVDELRGLVSARNRRRAQHSALEISRAADRLRSQIWSLSVERDEL